MKVQLTMKMYESRIGTARVAFACYGEGPSVILLHGLSGSSRWWVRNVPSLARHFRVYVVDLIGFGSSRGQRFTLENATGTILRWMETLKEDRFHLIGHSMGGYIAASAALLRSDMVEKLVLVDALALPFEHSVLRSAWGLLESVPHLPLDFYPVLVYDALRAGPVTLLRAIWDIHHKLTALEMARIQANTLIVWGDQDRLVPLQYGHRMQQGMPGASFALIRKAGHVPMWDKAEEFNRVVLQFL